MIKIFYRNSIAKRVIRVLFVGLCLYSLLGLVTPFITPLKQRSIKNQINYLSQKFDSGIDNDIQHYYPEGKIFSNALLALSIIEYCDKNDIANPKYARIVDKCILRIQSKKARSTFSTSMLPKYGMFYNAWASYLYHSYINSILFNYSSVKEEVQQETVVILDRLYSLQRDSIRLLPTYYDSAWPADNMIGIIPLAEDSIKHKWIDLLIEDYTDLNGLICHAGGNPQIARGSSSATITYVLGKAGYLAAQEYNQLYKSQFVDTYLGLELVKENLDGSSDYDIDSGPVLFGYGASATVMNIKTQASFNSTNAKITWGAMQSISFPINLFGNKRYLFGQEPMYDLFMLWASVEL